MHANFGEHSTNKNGHQIDNTLAGPPTALGYLSLAVFDSAGVICKSAVIPNTCIAVLNILHRTFATNVVIIAWNHGHSGPTI